MARFFDNIVSSVNQTIQDVKTTNIIQQLNKGQVLFSTVAGQINLDGIFFLDAVTNLSSSISVDTSGYYSPVLNQITTDNAVARPQRVVVEGFVTKGYISKPSLSKTVTSGLQNRINIVEDTLGADLGAISKPLEAVDNAFDSIGGFIKRADIFANATFILILLSSALSCSNLCSISFLL